MSKLSESNEVRVLFGGDFEPLGRYEQLISASGGNIIRSAHKHIAAADFTMFNLEAPICGDSGGIVKVGPVLQAAPETLRALTESGVDAVCLANNHILDHGAEGLSKTLTALDERGISHVGANLNRADAEAPLRVNIRGRRISIFSFAEQEFNLSEDGQIGAAILDPLRMAPLLLKERSQSDAIIVCVHGGNEYFRYPNPRLRQLCHFLINIGADAVIGHHPHVPGPYEFYQGKPIFFSLGNLIFDAKSPPESWDEGYLANLALMFGESGLLNIKVEIVPYQQAISCGGLRLLEGQERSDFIDRIENMRDCIENRPEERLSEWEDFVEKKQYQSIIDMSSPIRFRGMRRLMAIRFVRNLISSPSRHLLRLNMMRCAAHHELQVAALKMNISPFNKPSKKADVSS